MLDGAKVSTTGGMFSKSKVAFDRSININPIGLTLIAFGALGFIYFMFGSFSFGDVGGGDGQVSVRQLLTVAVEAAKRGGAEVKRVRELADIGESSKGQTREGANNPVTDGDMLSHKQMYYTMKKAFPQVNVISEEHDSDFDMSEIEDPELAVGDIYAYATSDEFVNAEDVDVWIDPLDATQEYTENLRHFVTTMVCIAVKGKPVVGVIHKPFSDETYWAWAGPDYMARVTKNDAKKNKEANSAETSRIIVSRSHAGKVSEVANEAFGDGITVTPAGGAGYKSWEVIKGEQDAYVHVTLIKKWDICAGDAILRANGGRLTDLAGKDVDYSSHPLEAKNEGGVLATMHNHEVYLEALTDAIAK